MVHSLGSWFSVLVLATHQGRFRSLYQVHLLLTKKSPYLNDVRYGDAVCHPRSVVRGKPRLKTLSRSVYAGWPRLPISMYTGRLQSTEVPMKTMAQVGLLASGSFYSPRLPIPFGTVARALQALDAAFVPGHSDGSATDSHRLPNFSPAAVNVLLP